MVGLLKFLLTVLSIHSRECFQISHDFVIHMANEATGGLLLWFLSLLLLLPKDEELHFPGSK